MWHSPVSQTLLRQRDDNWTTPKYSFKEHTRHDSPWWQPIYTLHSSVLKRGQNKKSGRIFCARQVQFTSKSWRRISWRVNQPFKHTFSHLVSGKQYYEALFYHTDLGQNLFFFALFKPVILQFFTILQENLHSFNIRDDQSTRFLCTTNYSIE